ncbi:MAG TPA: hypothetical protein DDW68_10590 [Verrucomicrobiales bacterium]|nr:hypothetical protein [Verrucomicrobiales bacterium]
MRREQSIKRLWLIAILCSIAIFVGILIIELFIRGLPGASHRTLEDHLANVIMLPIAALFAEKLWILLVACLVPVFMGVLIWVIFALRSLYKSPEKNNLPSPRTQTEGGISESPQTQTEGSSNESGPPPLPLPRRPR